MGIRLDLQNKLEDFLGSRQVYYQPPETIKMVYPAIVYSKKNIRTTQDNDHEYSKNNSYEIIVIHKRPDNTVIDKILELPYSSYDRSYTAENLNHDVLTIYF